MHPIRPDNARHSSTRSLRALDALTFFAPDVQGGVGPFLVVFMSSTLMWAPDRIGSVMAASALVGLLVQAPAGALIDRVRAKPAWIAGAVAVIAASLVAMVTVPAYPVILAGQSVIGAAGTLVAPAVAAISLGLVGRGGLDARVGRNAAVGAAGTVLWALGAGWIGRTHGAQAMFWFACAMAVPTIASALAIRDREIDARLARGADRVDGDDGTDPVGRWYDRRLVVLLSSAFLFHLANAAMLTLVTQEIATVEGTNAALWLAGGVIITQLVTIPIGLAVGRWAPRLPRKPVFLLAFAVLPVRGLLYLVVHHPVGLLALQVLDGLGAGVFGVMLTLMVGDLTRGSGRFNFALGIAAVAVGAGAALSNLGAGAIAQASGYAVSFVALACVAGAALALFSFGMPETRCARGNSPALFSRPCATRGTAPPAPECPGSPERRRLHVGASR